MDASLLKSAIIEYAAITGYVTRAQGGSNNRVCNRADKASTNRKYKAGNLKCGCSFNIRHRPSLYRPHRYPSGKIVSRPVYDDGYFVTISLSVTDHAGGCNPSPQQQVMQKSRSGMYVSNISMMALYTLCGSLLKGEYVGTEVSSCLIIIHLNLYTYIIINDISIDNQDHD